MVHSNDYSSQLWAIEPITNIELWPAVDETYASANRRTCHNASIAITLHSSWPIFQTTTVAALGILLVNQVTQIWFKMCTGIHVANCLLKKKQHGASTLKSLHATCSRYTVHVFVAFRFCQLNIAASCFHCNPSYAASIEITYCMTGNCLIMSTFYVSDTVFGQCLNLKATKCMDSLHWNM